MKFYCKQCGEVYDEVDHSWLRENGIDGEKCIECTLKEKTTAELMKESLIEIASGRRCE